MSLYDVSVPTMIQTLTALSNILTKAEAYREENKIKEGVLSDSRLFPDMFPLSRQIQIATSTAKTACGRLTGGDVEGRRDYPDTVLSIPQLQELIGETIAFLNAQKAADFEGAEERTIEMPTPNGPISLTGTEFLMGFVMANFSFHVVTSYNILRHNGVPIGKMDYLGALEKK